MQGSGSCDSYSSEGLDEVSFVLTVPLIGVEHFFYGGNHLLNVLFMVTQVTHGHLERQRLNAIHSLSLDPFCQTKPSAMYGAQT